jgi:hypothetical protein
MQATVLEPTLAALSLGSFPTISTQDAAAALTNLSMGKAPASYDEFFGHDAAREKLPRKAALLSERSESPSSAPARLSDLDIDIRIQLKKLASPGDLESVTSACLSSRPCSLTSSAETVKAAKHRERFHVVAPDVAPERTAEAPPPLRQFIKHTKADEQYDLKVVPEADLDSEEEFLESDGERQTDEEEESNSDVQLIGGSMKPLGSRLPAKHGSTRKIVAATPERKSGESSRAQLERANDGADYALT